MFASARTSLVRGACQHAQLHSLRYSLSRAARRAKPRKGRPRGGIVLEYSRVLKTRPLLTKTISGFFLASIADVVAQAMEKRKKLDKRRVAAMAVFGALWTGPFNHVWLGWLANNVKTITGRLILQHGVWNPFVYLPFYFFAVGLGYGLSKERIYEKMNEEYVAMWTTCTVVWLPITGLMFARCPELYQSVFMSTVSLVWNVGLSYVSVGKESPRTQEATSRAVVRVS